MKIYNRQGVEILDLLPDDNSYRYKAIMGENTLSLYYSLPEFVAIPTGAYCDYKNERYFLLKPGNFKQNHSRSYEYTLTLDSYQSLLKEVKFKFFTMNAGVVDSPYELKFSLTLPPAGFAQLICDNMNIAEGTTAWTVGSCIESDPVCIDFNHNYCREVLDKLVDAFKTEYEIENKTLNIGKVEKQKDNPVPLKYGYNCGLIPGTSRSGSSDKKAITRLFIEGSDRNIDRSVYGSATLHMPVNHTINYMGVDYVTDATGTYIERANFTGRVVEDSLDVSKIYPKRVGTVSEVVLVNAEKCLYDIIDTDIPETLDYSQQLIAGETMTIIFQTGLLAGKEFEVKYIHADRRFELVPITENGLNYPDGALIPEAGDTYCVFHCMLPAQYVTSAETDALNEAVKFLYENEHEKYTTTGTLDELYAKRNWLAIGGFMNCGYFVELSDDNFQETPDLIRITAVKEYLNKPMQPELTLSNEVTGASISSVLAEIPAKDQAITRVSKDTERFARRSFRDVKETMEMLEASLQEFTPGISPVTVQTMQLLVGGENMQFRFVNSKSNPARVDHIYTYNNATKVLTVPAGILQHMTLGIKTLSPTHTPSEYKFWDMSLYVSPVLTDAAKAYYLYAECDKAGTTGTFILSETPIGMDTNAGYYHFLYGILSSESDGKRTFAPLYGFTEILPGRITTDKLISQDGSTYFNLQTGEIGGNIKFKSGSQYVDVAQGINDAVNGIQIGGRNLKTNSDFNNGVEIADGFSIYNNDTVNEPSRALIIFSGGVDNGRFQRIFWTGNHTTTKGIYGEIIGGWEKNTEYTISLYARVSAAQACNLFLAWNVNPESNTETISPEYPVGGTGWKKYIFKFKWGNTVEAAGRFFISVSYGSGSGYVDFDKLKIEKGNIETDHTLAPEDVQAEIQATNDFVNSATAGLQAQIDGNITSWFYGYVPTIANVPASGWNTDTLRNNHLGDLFYDTNTGKAYRFQLVSGVYSWAMITDTDITKALADAQKAQDTADGKRRVFVAQPTTPYDVGDLWVQGTSGDIMRCSVARATGSYSASDWVKASKYTDDTSFTDFVTNTYAADISSLTSQIDGKIETYFQEADPNTWAVGDRAGHNGDMWYNSTTNLLKRYNGTSNSWELIQDQKAIDAYNTAATAKDTADGKRRVFVAQPTTPYDIGDLWVQGTSGDIMRCSVARATGSYSASDWVKASKYTDDTAANAAQATANAAQSSAATALSKLTDIADDNKLTPGDKQMVKKEWDIIVAEYTKICNYANIYNQSYDDYMDAFNELNAYLPPLLANMTISSDINGAYFRSAFRWYYEARQDIYNSVATAIKAYTDNSIASIYVGGENMILNHRQTLTAGSNNYFYSLLYGAEYSNATAILGSISSDNLLAASEKSTVKAEWDAIAYQYSRVMATARINGASSTAYASAYAALEAYITPLLANMSIDSSITGSAFRSNFESYYTARQALMVASSAYLKNSTPYVFSVGSAVLTQGSAASLTLRLYDFYTGQGVMLTNVALSANRQIIKFTTPSSGNWSLIIYAGVVAYTAGNTVNLSQLMLQTGDKATAFSPAVRHVSDAMQGSTDIIGGLVATNLLMMKDAAGNIRGGLSGLQDDNVGMWTGGSYADALAGIAKIILKKDGAGQLAGGKINWDAAGAMNVGLFNIFSNLLSSGNISFTSEALENLASIGGGTTNIASPGSTSAASYNSYTAGLISSQFTLTKNSLVKFRVTRSLTIVASDYATCNIYVKNSANSTVYVSNRDKSATGNSSDNYDYAVNLQAGTYYVVVEIKLNGTNSGNSQTVSITGYNGVGTSISIEPISTLTKIANNGMYSYWGQSAYMFIRTDYGFEVRFGNFGIQVTTSGLKKMTDGVNWVTL